MAPGLRDLSRSLRRALAHPPSDGTPPPGLELSGLVMDPPRIAACVVVEGSTFGAVTIDGEPTVEFAAFLDGIQESHVADYAGAIPIVGGRSAAVIRSRVDRRMTTWGDGAREVSRLYAPIQRLSAQVLDDIAAAGLEIRDTLSANEESSSHPLELLRRAVDAVKADRELLEQELAESWVGHERAPLLVDGGLPKGPAASVSQWCVGVVKSHHVLYAPADALDDLLSLPEGARTTVTLIERSWGPRVLSWFLRLHESPSHDPFLGLVRVEIASDPGQGAAGRIAARADLVSRWILAERAPLSLPDARWDRMVYGIRDCEQYLRSIAR